MRLMRSVLMVPLVFVCWMDWRLSYVRPHSKTTNKMTWAKLLTLQFVHEFRPCANSPALRALPAASVMVHWYCIAIQVLQPVVILVLAE